MSHFKKTVFGGYRPAAVDAEMDSLTKQLEEAENDKKRWRHEAESMESRLPELEKAIADLTAENARLQAEHSKNEEIFRDIAKIYRRAYGAGHEIVCDSKQTAQQLLQRLTDRFDDTMGETEGILADYEAAEQEIATLFAALNQQIDDVAQSAAQMLERAKAFTDIYREIQHTVNETRQGAEELLSAYETQASEFLSDDANEAATEAAQTATQPPQPAETPTEKAEKPEKSSPDTAHSGRIRLVKRPAAVSAPAVEPQTAFQEEAAEAPLAQVQPEAANDAPAVQPAGDIDEAPVASAQPEAPAAAAPAAAKPTAEAAGFTQFGRKSRISAQDRNELLRKALLRNSGN